MRFSFHELGIIATELRSNLEIREALDQKKNRKKQEELNQLISKAIEERDIIRRKKVKKI